MALAKDEVPDRRFRILWHAETFLDAYGDKAAATPVYGVLGEEVYHWADNNAQVTEDEQDTDHDERENWVHLMLDKSRYLDAALAADDLARAAQLVNSDNLLDVKFWLYRLLALESAFRALMFWVGAVFKLKRRIDFVLFSFH